MVQHHPHQGAVGVVGMRQTCAQADAEHGYGSVAAVRAPEPRGKRFAQLAVMLAALSGLVVVAMQVGDQRATPSRTSLAEGWESWLQGLVAPLGFGEETKKNPIHLSASIVPTHTMNLALSKHLKLAKGSRLSTWVASPVENLARSCGKDRDEPCSAGQSTTAHGGAAKRAVDNVNETSWSGDSCTHTDTQNNPWWKVNFGRQVKVTGLRVYGRSDCCADRLQGFEVWVGNHNYEPDANAACALDQAAPADPNNYVDVNCAQPLKGTYLFIRVPGEGKILTLCEVEIHGEELPPDEGGYDPWGISNAGDPRPDQLPVGASRNTWDNIVNNKKNLLWCTEHFHYLGNRERCIHGFTGGPLLAKDPHVASATLSSATSSTGEKPYTASPGASAQLFSA